MIARSPIAFVVAFLLGGGCLHALMGNHPAWTTFPKARAISTAGPVSPSNILGSSAPTPTPSCHPLITHSSSQAVTAGNSANCSNGPPGFLHFDTSYWRAFNMTTFGNGQRYDITSAGFGIEAARSGTGTGQPVTVRLYTNNGGAFPGGTRTEIAMVPVTVMDTSLNFMTVPLNVTVPAGTSELVMEVFSPSGQTAGNSFVVGSNAGAQTGPSYVSAENCGNPTPTTTADIGFPDMHIVFNVSGICRTGAPAQALNISTRLRVETGDSTMIGGFILTGHDPKSVVLRGLGPSLLGAGINDVLADPVLALYVPAGFILFQNDNWRSHQQAQIQGTIYQPTDDRESAIILTLTSGAYTAVLTGTGQTTGVGLMEIYDNDQAVDSKLANLSTRGFVQTGDNVMIGGFILGGDTGNTRVVVRGIGPSLSQSGLSNVLANPTLELKNSNGTTLASNDNWQDDPASAAALSANGFALQNSLESGIFITLPPGAFTAILAGQNGGTGIGLVEVYNLH